MEFILILQMSIEVHLETIFPWRERRFPAEASYA